MKAQILGLVGLTLVMVACGNADFKSKSQQLSGANCKGALDICDATYRASPAQIVIVTPAVDGVVDYRVGSVNAAGPFPNRDLINCTAANQCTRNTGPLNVSVENGFRTMMWDESIPISTSTTSMSVQPSANGQVGTEFQMRKVQ